MIVPLLLPWLFVSVATETPDPGVRRYQGTGQVTGHRNTMIEDLLVLDNEHRLFLDSVPCILGFLRSHLVETQRTSFLIPTDLLDVAGLFMSNLNVTLAQYGLNGDVDPFGRQKTASSTIILARGAESLENETTWMLDTCGRDCVFVVVLYAMFEAEEDLLAEADRVGELMWSRRVARLMILARVQDTILLCGALTFRRDEECAPSYPTVISRCEDSVWTAYEKIGSPGLNGCIVNLAYFETYPYAGSDNETERLNGIEGLMVEEIVTSLDINLSRIRIEWDENVTSHEEIKDWVEDQNRVDLIIGGMLWSPDNTVDYTRTYEMARIVWIVPVTPNVSLRGLVSPFHYYVWLAIIGVLIVGGVAKVFLIRDISFLNIMALIIGVAVARQPRRTSTRIQFVFWALFGFFLTQFYLGALADQLMNASDLQIDTLIDLSLSNLRLAGAERFRSLLENNTQIEDQETEEQRLALDMIRQRFEVLEYNEYLTELAALTEGRTNEYALMVMLNVSRAQPRLSRRVHIMQEIMGNYPIALATWKGLPYLEPFNEKIQTLIEAGIVGLWADLATRVGRFQEADEENKSDTNDLRLQQFVPAFLLMAIGFSAGLLFFLLEVVAYPSRLLLLNS